ncbi:MAG: glycosyltransferase family 4 protein [Gemmatimonadaceae bacterium]|nr:glycosyltransferase family 4 protein [Gemmatimonadaceae bacterium]
MMRIALVSEYYYPHFGGVCEHVHFLARELRTRGHEVDIVTSRIGNAPDEPGVIKLGRSVPLYINGSQARVTLGVGRATLRKLFREREYDLIHVHTPLTPALPMFSVEAAEVPVVGTFHTNFDRSLLYSVFHRRMSRVAKRLDAAIAVSPTAAAAINRYFPLDCRIVPNGVDLASFHPGVAAPASMRDVNPYILFLGRLDPRNGLAELIRAFTIVSEQVPDARLIVVGDGPLRAHYQRAAEGNPAIRFEGAVKDARPAFYANATIYACPTTKASFGITLLEAMACGAPIVCSDIPGFGDVVRDGRDCLMVRASDAHSLANGLLRLLRDSALRLRLAESGLAGVQRYDWPRVTDAIVAIYEELLGGVAAEPLVAVP